MEGRVNFKYLVSISLILIISGCATRATSPYQLTVDDYMQAAPRVSLDMTKSQVVTILQPSQRRLKNTEIKQPDMYKKDGVLVEILYFRSGWQSDGLTTDDEFTPYLFNNGNLVAIGWAVLGGARSQGQTTSQTNVNTTTVVHPTTIIY